MYNISVQKINSRDSSERIFAFFAEKEQKKVETEGDFSLRSK